GLALHLARRAHLHDREVVIELDEVHEPPVDQVRDPLARIGLGVDHVMSADALQDPAVRGGDRLRPDHRLAEVHEVRGDQHAGLDRGAHPTTAIEKSAAPTWSSTSGWVASARTTWVSWPEYFCTSSSLLSIASTWVPSFSSVRAIEAPKRPSPMTSTPSSRAVRGMSAPQGRARRRPASGRAQSRSSSAHDR